jgi:hypothetical protein
VVATTVYLPNIASSVAVEATAMREGHSLTTRLGCNNVQMRSDSSDTVEACSGDQVWWGENSAIFADCVDFVVLVRGVTFKHCLREANEVSHTLARDSFSNKTSCNWVDKPPRFLLDRLINDVTIL